MCADSDVIILPHRRYIICSPGSLHNSCHRSQAEARDSAVSVWWSTYCRWHLFYGSSENSVSQFLSKRGFKVELTVCYNEGSAGALTIGFTAGNMKMTTCIWEVPSGVLNPYICFFLSARTSNENRTSVSVDVDVLYPGLCVPRGLLYMLMTLKGLPLRHVLYGTGNDKIPRRRRACRVQNTARCLPSSCAGRCIPAQNSPPPSGWDGHKPGQRAPSRGNVAGRERREVPETD